ncbi:MAG: ATP-binding protein, partial [Betaproteobacteria bacterium]|nr:ATP-binding protein [Betaproteobacteria bacterium]
AAAGALLLTPGLLWAAAGRDAAAAKEAPGVYLARVRGRVATSLNAPEVDGLPRVVNHDGTLAALRIIGDDDGNGLFMLLTGPRSVGKSLMLQKLAKELVQKQRRVVYIDARQYGPDLTRGIIAAVVVDPTFFEKMQKLASGPALKRMLAMASELVRVIPGSQVHSTVISGVLKAASEAVDEALAPASPPRLHDVLDTFIAACTRDGEYPVIFIDEANEAFQAAQGDTAAAARVRAELNLFTRITKQGREASIVLATSEHGLPFRLRALGYNTDHISKTVVAEEVPPAVMKDELMRMWGCGEHLATALLSMYGGHVLHASAAVRELAASTAPASMEGIAALGSLASAPALCLGDDTLAAAGVPVPERPEMRERVTAALRALVEAGSVPLDSEKDKVAEIISLANAGCVIPRAAAASGVPPDAWLARTPSGKEPKHILVPSSHIMRLLIASEVFPPPPA